MSVYLFTAVLLVVAFLCLFAAFKSLFKSGWFLKWLQGSAGLFALVLTVVAALLSLDLLSYFKLKEGQPLATLTFSKVAHQEFDVELVQSNASKALYRLEGDQWQLDVRLIQSPMLAFNSLPSYRLDRLSGRYLSLEQESNSNRTLHGLSDTYSVDFWEYLPALSAVGLLKSQYGSAAFMPMVDGGIYQVILHEKGIVAEPINEIAKQAIDQWK